MKFNELLPDWISIIFALNLDTREEELEAIREFYPLGSIVELEGFWEGAPERSYQISNHDLNVQHMIEVLHRCKQVSFMYLAYARHVRLYSVPSGDNAFIGKLTQVPNERATCTRCPKTNTYWKALL